MEKIIYFKKILIFTIAITVAVISLNFFKLSEVAIKKEPLLNNNEVALHITSEYNEYFVNQDIWIIVKVINNSNENYYLKSPLTLTNLDFWGTYPSGRIIDEGFVAEHISPIDSLELAPGSSYEKVIPLNLVIDKFLASEKKEIGIYKLNVKYQDLVSNELEINVTEPTGIDKELYDQTYNQLFVQNEPDTLKLQKLEELLNIYPTSKYASKLYNIFFERCRMLKYYDHFSENLNNFFEYNYDTYGVKFMLGTYNQELDDLANKYRGSKTDYIINQMKQESINQK